MLGVAGHVPAVCEEPGHRVVAEDRPLPDVVSIDLASATAILDDGSVCPVAGIYDGQGAEIAIEDHDELGPGEGSFVLGPTASGGWLSGSFIKLAEKRRWQ